VDITDLKYARSGDADIAYQRWGAGPDVIIIPGLVGNVELAWEEEVYRRARETSVNISAYSSSISVASAVRIVSIRHPPSSSGSTTSRPSWMPKGSNEHTW
jgi:hypothetical protein